MKKILFELILLLVLLPVFASATTYYVDATSGNDNSDGFTPGTAWKTIAKVNNESFNPGDDVLFKRGGIWAEQLVVPSSGNSVGYITFGVYGAGEKPSMNKVQLSNKNYVRIENLEINASVSNCLDISRGEKNKVINLTIKNCLQKGIALTSTNNNTIDSNEIYNVGRDGIMLFRSSNSYTASGNIIQNNIVHDCIIVGIRLHGYNDSDRAINNEVYQNTVYRGGDGIYLNWADSNLVYNNILYSNNNTASIGEGYGIGIQTGSDNIIYGNEIYDARTRGIEVWGGRGSDSEGRQYGNSDSNKIYQNRIYSNGLNYFVQGSNEGAGIMFSSAYSNNNQIYYNLIFNNARGLYLGPAPAGAGNVLYNNVIYGSAYTGISFYGNIEGWIVKNNIFSNNSMYAINAGSTTNIEHANNLYSGTGNLVSYNGVSYNAQTIANFEITAISNNPLFVDSEKRDFHLQSSSSAIDAGADVGLTQDFEGNAVPQGAAPDIGAYEYEGNAPPVCVAADINCDTRVDVSDLILVSKDFGKTTGYNTKCDTNKDNVIDIFDVVYVASRFT